ncbi:hypothetical protein [Leptolyngbya sp. NK1-12]|uniref:hypothetical protein n=1 Tax=Leptolyngbya sp. NK1-12 TaxID=2547451 RepID=UPI00292E3562|nr:hypothetical protein [Leptolyngbya sp. NK1-12]
MAVDLYNGQVVQTPEQARPLSQAAMQNPQALEVNLRQAYQYLETRNANFGQLWSTER